MARKVISIKMNRKMMLLDRKYCINACLGISISKSLLPVNY